MSLAQQQCLAVLLFLCNHWAYIVTIALIGVSGWDYYQKYLRINKDTDNVDLVKNYVEMIRLRRLKAKYKGELG